MTPDRSARVVAFYLPQFHPIPENDEWWSPGFTEWTNVAAARPLFRGHHQPHLPGELGFYDLRLADTRQAQSDLAQTHGVEAFCYWHYWFAGRQLLERPLAEVLRSGQPGVSFCLGWANQSWTGIWHGAPGRVLVEQTYPGEDDHRRHFDAVLPALSDPRALRVGGLPVFYVHEPTGIPAVEAWIELWRGLAVQAGLPGLHLVADAPVGWDALAAGFDSFVRLPWRDFVASRPVVRKVEERLRRLPKRVAYDALSALLVPAAGLPLAQYPLVLPNWDNTPRSGRRGVVLTGTSPEHFGRELRRAVAAVADRPLDHRLVFVKSWNEWAEGNHLEPDRNHGRGWLEQVRAAVAGAAGRTAGDTASGTENDTENGPANGTVTTPAAQAPAGTTTTSV